MPGIDVWHPPCSQESGMLIWGKHHCFPLSMDWYARCACSSIGRGRGDYFVLVVSNKSNQIMWKLFFVCLYRRKTKLILSAGLVLPVLCKGTLPKYMDLEPKKTNPIHKNLWKMKTRFLSYSGHITLWRFIYCIFYAFLCWSLLINEISKLWILLYS